MDASVQTGITECGLYTIAYMTAMAHGQDPTMIVFDQYSLRRHLGECFEDAFSIDKEQKDKREGKKRKNYINLL